MARAMPETVRVPSEGETLVGDLYGSLPSRRVAILVHGQQWDASGWRDVAERFVSRGLTAFALNLRGYDGSSGKTNDYAPPVPWSPVADLRAAKALLRERGAREIALVGASMGGHAILASSFEADVECIVSVSAPVTAVPDELSRKITGRKLFVCADRDSLSGSRPVAPHVLHCFDVVDSPKTLLMLGGSEHARGIFAAPYGAEAIDAYEALADCRSRPRQFRNRSARGGRAAEQPDGGDAVVRDNDGTPVTRQQATAIIAEPKMTVERMPKRSAARPMGMPPKEAPSQASE